MAHWFMIMHEDPFEGCTSTLLITLYNFMDLYLFYIFIRLVLQKVIKYWSAVCIQLHPWQEAQNFNDKSICSR